MSDMYVCTYGLDSINQIIEFYSHGGGRFMILRAKRANIWVQLASPPRELAGRGVA